MAMTSWCEYCGAIHLEGPFVPQCERCSPEENEEPLSPLVFNSAWIDVLVGSYASMGGVVFAALWVLQ